MTTKPKTLDDLFEDTLKDIYYAENKIVKSLPEMIENATDAQLKSGLKAHLGETKGHVQRLEQVFQMLVKTAKSVDCPAIDGIIDEAKEVMDDFKGEEAMDAGLVASAQTVEHYEIARYGTLKTWAGQLGMKDAVKLLDQTLQEEIKTDKLLSQIAMGKVNKDAVWYYPDPKPAAANIKGYFAFWKGVTVEK